jgi:hypothetical protein
LSARPTVLLWLDQPDAYLRAAEAAGLASAVNIEPVKLAADPPDDVLARTEALLAWRPPARLSARAPRLRWIQSLTAGVEQWLAAGVPEGIVLTCARGTHRLSMPENILGALFLLSKQLGPIVLDQRERRRYRQERRRRCRSRASTPLPVRTLPSASTNKWRSGQQRQSRRATWCWSRSTASSPSLRRKRLASQRRLSGNH